MAVVCAALALAGCASSGGTAPSPPAVTHTRTVLHTQSPAPNAFRPPRPAWVRPLPPGHRPRSGEQDRRCPYIKTGLTGICFRTKFFRQDGSRDWAFVFAKGRHLVIVYTQRSDTSRNALYIARAIAAKF